MNGCIMSVCACLNEGIAGLTVRTMNLKPPGPFENPCMLCAVQT